MMQKLLGRMGNPAKVSPHEIVQITERLNTRIQLNVDSGSRVFPGWLFKGLVLHFHHPSSGRSASAECEVNKINQSHRLRLASNIARFAGATTSDTHQKSVTHVVVELDISSTELSTLRGTLSTQLGQQKMPRIVTVEWIGESWKERTLLDEESLSPENLFLQDSRVL
jgi:DNA ligase-4